MKRSLLILFLAIASFAVAQHPSRLGYSSSTSTLLSATSINDHVLLYTDLYGSTPTDETWKKGYTFENAEGLVLLGVTDASTVCLPDTFSCIVVLEVKTLDNHNAEHVVTISLNVNYNKKSGVSYKEKDIYEVDDAFFIDAKIISISNASAKPFLKLELRLNSERYIALGSFIANKKPQIEKVERTTGKYGPEIKVSFYTGAPNSVEETIHRQAEEYDIEWTFIESEDHVRIESVIDEVTHVLIERIMHYDFKQNATRVTVGRNTTSFAIKNVFDPGILVFRYRTVAYYKVGDVWQRITGPWSIESGESSASIVVLDDNPDKGSFSLPASPPTTYHAFDESNSYIELMEKTVVSDDEHLPKMNWQYTVVYAEDGKRKENITYYDGSLRNRQTVTSNYSDESVLVQGNVYDYTGRAAIQVLPVPIVEGAFSFHPNINKNAAGNLYTAADFDKNIVNECATAIAPMNAGFGAANYYSASNALASGSNPHRFVPESNGYPFTQTEFMPDNTGRVLAQSGVGITHQISTGGKPTRYLYGTPLQEELNRLFGTEVGLSVHYKKTATIDANGQPSINYTDLKGKTIATALAANVSNGLDPLVSNTPRNGVEGDLLSKYDAQVSSTDRIFTKRIPVYEAGNYKFKYSFVPQDYYPPVCNEVETAPCYDCIYDLEISVMEVMCGTQKLDGDATTTGITILKRVIGGNPAMVDALNAANGTYTFGTDTKIQSLTDVSGYVTVNLPVGVYQITKKLTLNHKARENYEALFLANNLCKTLDDFIGEAYAILDTTGCEITCEECSTKFEATTVEVFLASKATEKGGELTFTEISDWTAYYNASKKRCDEICGKKTVCQTYLDILKIDVSPGGQYAAFYYDKDEEVVLPISTDPPSPYYKGVLNLLDITKYQSYKNIFSAITPTPTILVNGVQTNVYDLSAKDFIKYWKPEWANELVKRHPEYCEYEWCTSNEAMMEYEAKLQQIDTYNEASSLYVTATGDHDIMGDPYASSMTATISITFDRSTSTTADDETKFCSITDFAYYQVFCSTTAFHFQSDFESCVAAAKANFENCGPNKDLYWITLKSLYLSERRKLLDIAKRANCHPATPEPGIPGTPRFNSDNPVWAPPHIGEPTAATSADGMALNCTTQCESYKIAWEESLKGCGLNSAQMTALLDQLKTVCIKGCDAYNSLGSSSVSPANLAGAMFVSFKDVIQNFPATSSLFSGNIYDKYVCSDLQIRFPQAYGHNYFGTASPFADTCSCDSSQYNRLTKNVSQNEGLNPDCPTCLATSADPATKKALQMLKGALEEGEDSTFKCKTCIDCGQFATGVRRFFDEYDDFETSESDNTNNEKIFSNFLNKQFGFNYTFTDYKNFAKECVGFKFMGFQDLFEHYYIVSAKSTYTPEPTTIRSLYDYAPVRYAENTAPDSHVTSGIPITTYNIFERLQPISSKCAVSKSFDLNMLNIAFVPPPSPLTKLTECTCNYILDKVKNGTSASITVSGGATLAQLAEVCDKAFKQATTLGVAWSAITTWDPVAVANLEGLEEDFASLQPYSLDCKDFSCPNCGSSTTSSSGIDGPIGDNGGGGTALGELDCAVFGSIVTDFYYDPDNAGAFVSTSSLKEQLLLSTNSGLLTDLVTKLNDYLAANLTAGTYIPFSKNNIWAKWDRCINLCGDFTTELGNFIASNNLILTRTFGIEDIITNPEHATLKTALLALMNANVRKAPYFITFTDEVFLEQLRKCNPMGCDSITALVDKFREDYAEELATDPRLFREQIALPFRNALFQILLNRANNMGAQHPYHKKFTRDALLHLINMCDECTSYCTDRKDMFFGKLLNGLAEKRPNQTGPPHTRWLAATNWNIKNGLDVINTTTTATTNIFLDHTLYTYSKPQDLTYKIRYLSKTQLSASFVNDVDKPYKFELNTVIYGDGPGIMRPEFRMMRITEFLHEEVIHEAICTRLRYRYIVKYAVIVNGVEEIHRSDDASYGQTFKVEAITDYDPYYRLRDCDIPSVSTKLLCNKPIAQVMVVVPEDPCITRLKIIAKYNGMQNYKEYVKSLRNTFNSEYIFTCLSTDVNEMFKMKYDERQYHYTLYYYDQAGNLVKTIPPAGVLPLDATETEGIDAKRLVSTVYPVIHTKPTLYTYNTLNQLVWQTTPDAGASHFYYDAVGRLVASQNAKQQPGGYFSYTRYDGLGRIQEVGELKNPSVGLTGTTWFSTADKRQITRTYYDQSFIGILPQDNLRGRVVSSTYQEIDNGNPNMYDYGSHYSYDISGNVKRLVREVKALENIDPETDQDLKQVDYQYDVVSGKVNRVIYQEGASDQYIHEYHYDEENRITAVFTGTNNYTLEKDAEYFYYLHGPLSRTVMGSRSVQGMDYAYTINGWLKGVNSETLTPARDIGNDGAASGNGVGKDEFGFVLQYYQGDYTPAGGSGAGTFMAIKASSALQGSTHDLYNGNISIMTTSIAKFMQEGEAPLASAYKYDQLNRLVEAKYFNNISDNTWDASGTALTEWYNSFIYDADGNIKNQVRRSDMPSKQGGAMDNLTYQYEGGTNRLKYVQDAVTDRDLHIDDIDGQAITNYDYDKIGNLILDESEEIENITWNVYGKITKIKRTAASEKPDLEFGYSPDGHRVLKVMIPKQPDRFKKYTYYMRDAQGNILATYERSMNRIIDFDTLRYGPVNDSLVKYLGLPGFADFVEETSNTTGFKGHLLTNLKTYEALLRSFNPSYLLTNNSAALDDMLAHVSDNDYVTTLLNDQYPDYDALYDCYNNRNIMDGGFYDFKDAFMHNADFVAIFFNHPDFHRGRLFSDYGLSSVDDVIEYLFDPGVDAGERNHRYNILLSRIETDRYMSFHNWHKLFADLFEYMHEQAIPLTFLSTTQGIRDILYNTAGAYECDLTSTAENAISLFSNKPNMVWTSLLETHNTAYWLTWLHDHDPDFIYKAAYYSPATVSTYQQANNMYSASGNGMQVYFMKVRNKYGQVFYDNLLQQFYKVSKAYSEKFKVNEWMIYGSSRLGDQKAKLNLVSITFYANQSGGVFTDSTFVNRPLPGAPTHQFTLFKGKRQYELSNHLGNVLAVVSDKKTLNCTDNTYMADVIQANDYSPFGAPLTGRTWNTSMVFSNQFRVNSQTQGWAAYSGSPALSVTGGRLIAEATGNCAVQKAAAFEQGTMYELVLDMDANNYANMKVEVSEYASGSSAIIASFTTLVNGKQVVQFVATKPQLYLRLTFQGTGTGTKTGYIEGAILQKHSPNRFIKYPTATKNITVTSRTGNTPEYRVSESVTFEPGFESAVNDEFETVIEQTSLVNNGSDEDDYRFGFNGKESDNEIYGTGNSYDYGLRIYNPRLGRFLSVDPLSGSFPWNSTYAYAENDVIRCIDLDGLEKVTYTYLYTFNGDGSFNNVKVTIQTQNTTWTGAAIPAQEVHRFIAQVEGGKRGLLNVINEQFSSYKAFKDYYDKNFGSHKEVGKRFEENGSYLKGIATVATFEAIDNLDGSNDAPPVGEVQTVVKTETTVNVQTVAPKVEKIGTIYKVPGSATRSGKPYIGRHNKPNPQVTRKANDGRDRTKAEVIDSYDPNNVNQGRYKEQKAIDANGGVDNLDNKRNEISTEKLPEFENRYGKEE